MSSVNKPLDPAIKAFIAAAIDQKALLFGSFVLKSGRVSPYFFNAGKLYTGSLLQTASDALASLSKELPEFDVLFGPAYKGIPLAATTSVALNREGRNVGYAYNRKEAKDHGEGGVLVGAPLEGRVLVIDDVITSGKAIREAISIISTSPSAKLVAVLQLLDRQETGPGESGKSAIQMVEEEFEIPVRAVIRLEDIVGYLEEVGGWEKELGEVRKYREQYGIKA